MERGLGIRDSESSYYIELLSAFLISLIYPPYRAVPPSSSSMRISWLYLAVRSLRLIDPVLICPALMEKAQELSEKIENAKDDMSSSQLKRYMEITMKMTNAVQ